LFDIPFVRFATPCVILYLFYWMLIVNPPVDEEEHGDRMSADTVYSTRKKCEALVAAKKYSEAMPLYRALNKSFPENHTYQESLANIYHALGRYAEEAQMWEQYVQHAPIPVEGCPQIAEAYRAAGSLTKTLNAQKRCYEFDTDNSDTIFFYAHELERQDQLAQSLELYEKGHRLSRHYPDISTGLARVQMRLGRRAVAVKLIDEVLQTHPNNVDALLIAGILAYRGGDAAAARAYLEHALKVSPTRGEVQEELALIPDPSKRPVGRVVRKSRS
jgi:tetratricopeptide (TPR) repeat protein